jgi:hypothetical protein
VPSASRHSIRLASFGASTVLLAGAFAGCSTTQEKAEHQQARAQHILDARAERQKRKKHADGPKNHLYGGKSAHRSEKGQQQ